MPAFTYMKICRAGCGEAQTGMDGRIRPVSTVRMAHRDTRSGITRHKLWAFLQKGAEKTSLDPWRCRQTMGSAPRTALASSRTVRRHVMPKGLGRGSCALDVARGRGVRSGTDTRAADDSTGVANAERAVGGHAGGMVGVRRELTVSANAQPTHPACCLDALLAAERVRAPSFLISLRLQTEKSGHVTGICAV